MLLTNKLQTELALRARNDSEALTELIAEYSSSVWSFIHKRMSGRSYEDKEDVYQNIMFNLYCSISSFKGKSSFFTWFRRIQVNRIADYYRRNSRNIVFLMEDLITLPDKAIELEWDNVYDEYKELLPKRHYDHFNVIYDIAVNGYTLSDVAEEYNKDYETIRSQCRRGKVFLKEDLEKRGVTY